MIACFFVFGSDSDCVVACFFLFACDGELKLELVGVSPDWDWIWVLLVSSRFSPALSAQLSECCWNPFGTPPWRLLSFYKVVLTGWRSDLPLDALGLFLYLAFGDKKQQ